MKHLIKAIRQEYTQRIKETLTRIETEEGLKHSLSFHGRTYKGNAKAKLTKYILAKYDKELKQDIAQIERVNKAKTLPNSFIITVEWKKSYMWGSNPRAYTNYGFTGSSIGGCGYCKKSTATAEALNSCDAILRKMYCRKNKELGNPKKEYTEQNGMKGNSQNHINVDILGYGSGHGIIPRFSGGVGVSCHQRIIERLGMKWMNVSSTNNTNVYMISK